MRGAILNMQECRGTEAKVVASSELLSNKNRCPPGEVGHRHRQSADLHKVIEVLSGQLVEVQSDDVPGGMFLSTQVIGQDECKEGQNEGDLPRHSIDEKELQERATDLESPEQACEERQGDTYQNAAQGHFLRSTGGVTILLPGRHAFCCGLRRIARPRSAMPAVTLCRLRFHHRPAPEASR